jgi:hypothetical protein
MKLGEASFKALTFATSDGARVGFLQREAATMGEVRQESMQDRGVSHAASCAM